MTDFHMLFLHTADVAGQTQDKGRCCILCFSLLSFTSTNLLPGRLMQQDGGHGITRRTKTADQDFLRVQFGSAMPRVNARVFLLLVLLWRK